MKRYFVFILLSFFGIGTAYADQTIDQLTAGGALAGTEKIPIFQTANPAVSTTPAALATYVLGSTTFGTGLSLSGSTISLTSPARSTSSAAIISTDAAKIVINTSGGMTIANATGGLGDGFGTNVLTVAAATITPTTATINGNSTEPLGINQGASIFSLSGQYYALLGMPEPVASSVLVASSGRVPLWQSGTSGQLVRGNGTINSVILENGSNTILNYNAAAAPTAIGKGLQIVAADSGSFQGVSIHTFGGSGNIVPQFTGLTGRGTDASKSALQSGEFLVAFDGVGYGATGYGANPTGGFLLQATENFTDTAQGTAACIWTTPNTTIVEKERACFLNGGGLAIDGTTSGSVTLKVPAAAGSNTITLPAGTTDFSSTGGTGQVVRQSSAGVALTVATLACSDFSNGATGCSTATGTSGATIGLLNGSNTYSGTNSHTGAETFAEVHGGLPEAVTLSSNDYVAVATDCGKIKVLPTGTTPTVHLPNLNVGCTITFVTSVAISYQILPASGGTVWSSTGFNKTRGTNAGDTVSATITVNSASAAKWSISGDVTS